MSWCPAPGSSLFAYGTTSRALRLGSVVGEEGEERMELELELPEYHAGSIYGIAWHPTGKILATGSNDKSILLTKIGHGGRGGGITHGEPTTLSGHTGTVRCVEWCDRAGSMQVLSAGAGDCALRLWDAEQKCCIGTLSGHLDHVQALAVSASSPVVASGGKDGQVRLWDMRQQSCIRNLASGKEEVLSLHLNPSDTILAGGFADAACLLWEMRMGRMVQTLKHHQHQCRSVHYASDGRWLLTASFDGTVACVDVSDGHVSAVLTGHTDRVVCARTHPRQPWVLSCGVDKTVRLWA